MNAHAGFAPRASVPCLTSGLSALYSLDTVPGVKLYANY